MGPFFIYPILLFAFPFECRCDHVEEAIKIIMRPLRPTAAETLSQQQNQQQRRPSYFINSYYTTLADDGYSADDKIIVGNEQRQQQGDKFDDVSQRHQQKHQTPCGQSPYEPPGIKTAAAENVIDGHIVPNSECLPWMVNIYFEWDERIWRYCTGTIISERFILTAAHCFVDIYHERPEFNMTGPWPPLDTRRFSILAGVTNCQNVMKNGAAAVSRADDVEGGGQVWRRSKRVYPHPKYKYAPGIGLTYNDIALIELDGLPLTFNASIKQICLNESGGGLDIGEEAVVAGWGMIIRDPSSSTNLLHDGHVYVLPAESCERIDPNFEPTKAICTSGRNGHGDPCHGDSGGPLMKKLNNQWTQFGVVSGDLGFGCRSPDVFTKIDHEWINGIIGRHLSKDL